MVRLMLKFKLYQQRELNLPKIITLDVYLENREINVACVLGGWDNCGMSVVQMRSK